MMTACGVEYTPQESAMALSKYTGISSSNFFLISSAVYSRSGLNNTIAKLIRSPYFFTSAVKCGTLKREHGHSGLKKWRKKGLSAFIFNSDAMNFPFTGFDAS